MPFPADQVTQLKSAAIGHVFAVEGAKVVNRANEIFASPLFARTLAFLKNGNLGLQDCFTLEAVQHPERVLLMSCFQLQGDIEISVKVQPNISHILEESGMQMSRDEAQVALTELAKLPSATTEEELTLLTLQAVFERLESLTKTPTPPPAVAQPAA